VTSTALAAGVSTAELTRRFGRVTAVDRVSLDVPRGSVYGFLGPNGSGKTTTIRMLLGLVAPHSGEVELLGQAIPGRAQQVLPRVGALIEGPAFHAYMSGRDNLRRLDACDATADPRTRDRRIDDALHRVGLAAAAKKKYRQYSLGMKQRLGLAAALLQPRDLLILDEPTNGLDPQGTREVRHLVRSLAADGTTVLVSSHLLAEIEHVATHVGIMSAGRLLAQGALGDVLGGSATTVVVLTPDPERARAVLARLGMEGVSVAEDHSGEAARVSALLGGRPPEDLNRLLVEAGVRVAGLSLVRPNLEDLFVSLTGEGFDVAH
jgi:ABC-type multidrug transport system ATPase subunit